MSSIYLQYLPATTRTYQQPPATISDYHLPSRPSRFCQELSATSSHHQCPPTTSRTFQLQPGPISYIQQPSVTTTYLQDLPASLRSYQPHPATFRTFQLLLGAISHFSILQCTPPTFRTFQPLSVPISALRLPSGPPRYCQDISATSGSSVCFYSSHNFLFVIVCKVCWLQMSSLFECIYLTENQTKSSLLRHDKS